MSDATHPPEHEHAPHESGHGNATHSDSLANSDPMAASSEPLHIDRFEGLWIRISVAMLTIFAILVIYASTALGIQLPGAHGRIDPRTVATPGLTPFGDPKVTMIAEGEYEAYIRSQIWQYTPSEIRLPVGAKLTMYITSQDVQHGFIIERTNVNVMVLPGQITKVATTFKEPGTYNFICHEYCGIGHHTMFGRVIVETPEEIAAATATAQAPPPAAASATGNADHGKELFVTCAACHGPAGGGVTGLGKPLTTSEFVAGLSDADMVNFLKVGRAMDDPLNTTKIAMPPKGGNPALNDADLLDIVAYLRVLQQAQ